MLAVRLGQKLGIPDFDGESGGLQGHSEIDPATTHTMCPQRALNGDGYGLARAGGGAGASVDVALGSIVKAGTRLRPSLFALFRPPTLRIRHLQRDKDKQEWREPSKSLYLS